MHALPWFQHVTAARWPTLLTVAMGMWAQGYVKVKVTAVVRGGGGGGGGGDVGVVGGGGGSGLV